MLAAMERFLRGYARKGALLEEPTYPGAKASIYRRLAALLNAGPDELALVHNTAEGMNFISHGLSLSPGDEILVLENEYPSNYYPWEHWKGRGVALKAVPCGLGPSAFLRDFEAALGPRVRVATLSAVHWCTGLPLPLREAGRLCAERGVELVVDGAQGVGLVDLDVKACGIGYMAFSAWKWLLGPVGLGILYVSRDRLDRLKPVFKGTESVTGDEGYLPYRDTLKPTADRFAYSSGSFSDWVYFDASLAYLEGIGFDRARSRILDLAGYLSDRLRDIGFDIHSDRFEGARTGIVSLARPGFDAASAVRALKSEGIVAAERLGRLRLAPHVYNSEVQLDRTARVLEAFADPGSC